MNDRFLTDIAIILIAMQAINTEVDEWPLARRTRRTPRDVEKVIQEKITQRSDGSSGPKTPTAHRKIYGRVHEIPSTPKCEGTARGILATQKNAENFESDVPDVCPELITEALECKTKLEPNLESSICETALALTPRGQKKQNQATNTRVRGLGASNRLSQKQFLAKIEKDSNSEQAFVNFLRQTQATPKRTAFTPSKTSLCSPLPTKQLNLPNVTPITSKKFSHISRGSRKLLVAGATGVFGKVIGGVFSSCSQENILDEPRRTIYYQVVNTEKSFSTESKRADDSNSNNIASNCDEIIGGDTGRVVLRYESNGRWIIGHPALRSQRTVLLAYCAQSELSDPVLATRWYVANSSGTFLVQPCLKVTVVDATNQKH